MPKKKNKEEKTPKEKWAPVPTTEDVTQTPEEREVPDVEEVIDGETAAISDDDQDIEDILAQLPQETRVELARWSTAHDDWSYAGRYPAHGFSVDRVARERGPGRYRIIIRGPNAPGSRRMVTRARRQFFIDESMAPQTAAAPGGGEMSGTLSKMIELNLQMMQTVMTSASAPPEKMSDVVAAVAALMQPQHSQPQENPIELAVKLLELTKGNDEKSSLDDMLGIMDRMRDWVSENESPDGGGLGAFAATMSKFIDVATKEREEQRRLATGQPATVAPEVAPGQSESERIALVQDSPQTQDEIAVIARTYFESLTPVLLAAGERNADPALYADVLLDALPAELEPYLDEWILTDDYPAVLMRYFPGVAGAWLQQVLFVVKSVIESGADETEPPIEFRGPTVVGDDANLDGGEPGNVATDGPGDAPVSQ